MKNYEYRFNCVGCPNVNALIDMIDISREITRETFIKNVGIANYKMIEQDLGYDKYLSMKNDYHVRYCKSKYKSKQAYYIIHSAIEYVFY